jgi:hypothetical protein
MGRRAGAALLVVCAVTGAGCSKSGGEAEPSSVESWTHVVVHDRASGRSALFDRTGVRTSEFSSDSLPGLVRTSVPGRLIGRAPGPAPELLVLGPDGLTERMVPLPGVDEFQLLSDGREHPRHLLVNGLRQPLDSSVSERGALLVVDTQTLEVVDLGGLLGVRPADWNQYRVARSGVPVDHKRSVFTLHRPGVGSTTYILDFADPTVFDEVAGSLVDVVDTDSGPVVLTTDTPERGDSIARYRVWRPGAIVEQSVPRASSMLLNNDGSLVVIGPGSVDVTSGATTRSVFEAAEVMYADWTPDRRFLLVTTTQGVAVLDVEFQFVEFVDGMAGGWGSRRKRRVSKAASSWRRLTSGRASRFVSTVR